MYLNYPPEGRESEVLFPTESRHVKSLAFLDNPVEGPGTVLVAGECPHREA